MGVNTTRATERARYIPVSWVARRARLRAPWRRSSSRSVGARSAGISAPLIVPRSIGGWGAPAGLEDGPARGPRRGPQARDPPPAPQPRHAEIQQHQGVLLAGAALPERDRPARPLLALESRALQCAAPARTVARVVVQAQAPRRPRR